MKYLFIFLILSIVLISGCIKDCGTDLTCFIESAKYCSSARVNIINQGNNIRLTSRGIWFGKCKLSLKIEEIGEELKKQDPDLARIATGKTINCAVPVEIVNYDREAYIKEILTLEDRFNQYCSGPIKDALQGHLKEIIKEEINIINS